MGFDTPLDWEDLNERVGYFSCSDTQDVITHSVFPMKPEHSHCCALPVCHAQHSSSTLI